MKATLQSIKASKINFILDSIYEGILVQDENGIIIYANLNAAKILGFKDTSFIVSKSVVELRKKFVFINEQGSEINSKNTPTARVNKSKEPITQILGFRRQERKRMKWVMLKSIPFTEPDQKVTLIINIIREITDHQKALETLSFQKSLLDAENEVAQNGKLIVSPQGKVIWFNKRYLEMWGIEDINLLNKSEKYRINLLKHKARNEVQFAKTLNRINRNPNLEQNDEVELKNGRWLDRYTSPLIGKDGKNYGRIWFVRDITERKLSAKKQEVFLGITTHELKTPLASMKAYNYLTASAAEKSGNTKILEYTKKIDEQINKLNTLVKDLLDISSIRAGHFELNKEVFDFDTLIYDIVDNIKPTTSHKIIIHGKTSKYIEADRMRVEELFTNLIKNAIKYSPNAKKVLINLTNEKKYIVASIKDYGVGIPKNKLRKIFNLFERAAKDSKISGTGLGLYIAQEIIKAHRGIIKVNSKVKAGSTFTVKFPLH